MKIGQWIFCWLLMCAVLKAHSQQFGGFPPSTRWRQINTDTARIIFSKGAEWQAERVAALIHKAAADTPFALGGGLHKINVVLHNRTTLANGYVSFAPFRSEYYLVPGSNVFESGNQPWYETLGIHEYRHVQQYNNFRHGLSKGFYYLFGESGLAFANAIAIPDWFFEGDAVHSETALSKQGRGRLSLFLSGYNSLWLEGKNYSWMKLRNGSLKDYVPDHYQLGYLLVNYGYLRYGPSIWGKVTQDASAFRGLFYPFQSAIKKYTGVTYKTFRKEALDYYRQQLGAVHKDTAVKTKTVTRYYFPQYISPDSLLYLKTAYNKLPAFYIRTSSGEHKLELQSISTEQWLSYRQGKMVYTAYSTDPRWSLVDYSDIVLYDFDKRKEERLTHKARYYTPDLSPSGTQIVAIHINDSLQTIIEILNSTSGKVVKQIRSDKDIYYTHPRFVDENRIVVGVRTPDSKMSLVMMDLASPGHTEPLVPFSYNTIGFPFVKGDTIFFTANYHSNDDVYAYRLQDKKVFQLTQDLTGNYYPSVFNDTLVWSHFTAEGMNLEKQNLSTLSWKEVDDLQNQINLFPVSLSRPINNMAGRQFASKPYNQTTEFFHFHSWRPDYQDPEFTFSLYSDNMLNTFSNELYYLYNQDETSHSVGWNTSFGGWFPVLTAGAEYTFNRTIKTTTRVVTQAQMEAHIGYSIPLSFTKGKTYRFLSFGSNYVFNRAMPTGESKNLYVARNQTYFSHFINWANYLPMAVQHIYPKFGYTLSVRHSHLLTRNQYQFLSNAQLFLPSFANHSIVITGSFQQTDTNSLIFTNRFANSRGYEDYYLTRMWKAGVNYHFPIFYPDFGIANIVYFQRLRGNAFYDYARVYSNDKSRFRNLRSVGGELYFDTKWWNQQPVSFGFRVSHLLDKGLLSSDRKGSNFFEFILPVSLLP